MRFISKGIAAMAIAASLASPAFAQIVAGNNQPNFTSLIDNGNMNLAQRGTTAVTAITTSAKYLWDRWAAVSGTSTSVTLTNITSGVPSLFTNAAQVARVSGQSGVVKVCFMQEIPTSDITPLAGQPVTLSFWATAGSGLTSAGNVLTAQVTTGTGADEGLATWLTGLAGAASAIPAANAATTLTTAWQRFAVTGTLAATTTEAVVNFCYTPVGTAGSSDYFQITGVQLQQGTTASNFEVRPIVMELEKAQRYYWQWLEPANSYAAVPGMCSAQSTTVAVCSIPLPVQMRAAPTVACAFGTLKRQVAGTATALTACAAAATTNGVSAVGSVNITATVASGNTAGFSGVLTGGNSTGGGLITASADF